jgi:serine/threonine protein kinase
MYLEEIMSDFGIDSQYVSSDLSLPTSSIPKQQFDGYIYINKSRRCRLLYKEINNQGRYGLIQKCNRIDSATQNSETVVVKRPRLSLLSLAPEAILQAVCFKTIMNAGLNGSIAKPYDIFMTSNEIRYTMEYIDGISFHTFLNLPGTEEKTFLNCLMQLCFILYTLDIHLNFDHRDLRIENIWIRPLNSEQVYTLKIDGVVYNIAFKYQVILLDFGFACIGDSTRKAIVNLGNEVFSPIDPCPKAGRDLYQLLNSVFENKQIQEKFSHEFLQQIQVWMKPHKIRSSNLSYIITYDPNFENKFLQPIELIRWFFRK